MRSSRPPLAAPARDQEGRVVIASPAVGLWRGMPEAGAWLAPGAPLGWVEVLGARQPLVLPGTAGGRVVERAGRGRATVPVGHGDTLLVLERSLELAAAAPAALGASTADAAGPVFRSPMSGRFYRRPGPGKDPFVEAGAIIAVGHTLCLLEVMKTFNRIAYGGPGLPERARVLRVCPADGDDLEAGDAIVEVEPA